MSLTGGSWWAAADGGLHHEPGLIGEYPLAFLDECSGKVRRESILLQLRWPESAKKQNGCVLVVIVDEWLKEFEGA